MIYNVNTEKELLQALKVSENSTTINIEKDITLSEAIVIENGKDIKIMSKKGCKLIGGIITNEWNVEGEYVKTFPRQIVFQNAVFAGNMTVESAIRTDNFAQIFAFDPAAFFR